MGTAQSKDFLWLAFKRRHWTGDRRARHGLEARELCYLCDKAPETIDHILATCPFSREIWFYILQAFGRQSPQATATMRWWQRLRSLFDGEPRSGLDSLFALVSWQIWKERNARCFRGETASVNKLLQLIKAEADRWIEAGARGLGALASV
jgi:hypothetical protein